MVFEELNFFEVWLYVLFNPVVWFFLAPVLLFKYYLPVMRNKINDILLKYYLIKLPKDKYVLLDNIVLEDEKGIYHINHIIVSQYGIFVIEMKNYYGGITGNENQEYWFEYIKKKRYKFDNPIIVNKDYIKRLQSLLNIGENKFISIVTFINDITLKINNTTSVIHIKDIYKTIMNYTNILIDKDINEIVNIILENNIKEKQKRKQCYDKLKERIKDYSIMINNNICPGCGNQLILNKRNKCSNCKYKIKKISNK